ALGATYEGQAAGTLGALGCFSFNGNKIITTSGGGMLVSSNREWIERARMLASQAREPAVYYEPRHVGYNYRLSNLLAAGGRGQLSMLDSRVRQRRTNNSLYRQALAGMRGIRFMPQAGFGTPTCWLSCITVEPAEFGVAAEDIRLALEQR